MSHFGSSSSLSYQGLPIEYHPVTGLVCLTDLWRAQCSPASQRPLAWVRLEATQKLLKRLARQSGVDPLWSERQHPGQEIKRLIAEIPGILETNEEDSDLRTYATSNLVVVYAYYLAPECYEWALANLAEGTALVEQWSALQSETQLQERRKAFTRRAVLAAGWSIPVVSALALNQRAAAQISPGAGGTGTTGTGTGTGTGTTGTGTGTTGTGTTGTGTGTTGTGTGTTGTGTTGTGTGTTGTGTGTTGTGTTGTGTGTTGTGTGTTGTGTTGTGTGTTGTGTGTTGTGTGTTGTGTGTTGTGTGTTGTGTGTTGTGTTGTGTGTTGTGTGL
jgi:hypothetical protein